MHLRRLLDAALLDRFNGESNELAMPVTDNEWAGVQDLAYNGSTGIDNAVKRIVMGRRTYVLDRPRRVRTGSPSALPTSPLRSTREDALAEYLATYMEQDPGDTFGIRGFRQELLKGRMLTASAADRWIIRRAPSPLEIRKGRPAGLVPYIRPDSPWARHVATLPGTPLDRLRIVSDRVAKFTRWNPARTTMFVLTGERPPLPAIVAKVEWKSPISARSRIVLDVDPTCPPQEVIATYRKFRSHHFPRLRRLSPRHARLAVFALKNQQLRIEEQMRLWTTGGRSPKYKKASAFTRACQLAVKRLTELRGDVRPGP